MNRIWTVARRELKALFDHPTAYVLLVIFLGINAFLFFRQAYLSNTASMRPMLDLLPWMLLFFVPAVTMRSLAEDTRNGLLEVVLAQPLTEFELLMGKYVGSVLFLWITLAFTLPMPVMLALGSEQPWGTVAAQYAGAALLAAGLAGVGVWASSLTRSQITAFIVAVGVMFVFVLVGLDPLVVGLPPMLGAMAARLGVLSHFQSIGRGVIDLRDVIYFLSLAGVFLALAYGALVSRKLARGGGGARRLRMGVAVLVATLVVVNLFGSYIRGRLDLTPGKAYTLSEATEQMVRGLDDLVTIKLFASKELPTEVALLKRDIDDLLQDIRSASGGNVRVIEVDPKGDTDARNDARSLGIQPVQFNVVGNAEFQVKEGYLGIAVQHADKSEIIPFVSSTMTLEYRLAGAIRTLTREQKPVIGLVEGITDEPDLRYGALRQGLAKLYDVRSMLLSDSAPIPPEVSVLVLAGIPDSVSTAETSKLNTFFDRGGSALVFTSGMGLSKKAPTAVPKPAAWNPVLKRFGVSVRSDMVYDLRAGEVVPVPGQGGSTILRRYPFFIRSASNRKSIVNQEANDAIFTWPSSLDTTTVPGLTITPLFATTASAGEETGETVLEPTRDFADSNLATRLLAVQVAPSATPAKGDSAARGRVIVVGDYDFVSDRWVRMASQNLGLTLNAIDWLSQDEAFIGIRSKNRRPPSLTFASAGAQDIVKYANVIGVPLLIVLWGIVRMARRRRKSRQPYTPIASGSTPARAA